MWKINFQLVADVELSVRNGAELLDRLLKDIIAESSSFDMNVFVCLLKARLKSKNPVVQQFLLSWISFFDSLPGVDLVSHLSHFLQGLLEIMTESTPEISVMVKNCLQDFLTDIKSDEIPESESNAILDILIPFLSSRFDSVKLMSLEFLLQIASIPTNYIASRLPALAQAILPSLGTSNVDVKQNALKANTLMTQIYMDLQSQLDVTELVKIVVDEILNENENTRVVALDWLLLLQKKSANERFILGNEAFHSLLKALMLSSSEEVIQRDLKLLAQISLSSDGEYLPSFISNLLSILAQDTNLLEKRGNLLFRQLCLSLTAEKLFITISQNLQDEKVRLVLIGRIWRLRH